MEYLKCEKVRKQFGSVQALKDLSFSVEKGEIRAILGGNGSGKSTMAKIIGGALDVTSGTIKLNGKDYAPKSPAEAKQFGVIFTSQELSLFDNLNVEENIHLCNLPLGKGDSIDHQRVNQSTLDLAQKYGLEYLLNIPIAQMAANELYLVEFLKAIIQKPTLLIVDEITSALYRNDVEKIRDILFELKEAGCTILFISHRMGEIMSICDSVTVLKNGETVGTYLCSEVTEAQLLSLMSGRAITDVHMNAGGSNNFYNEVQKHDTILKVEQMPLHGFDTKIDFSVHSGEIIGVAGLQGQGQSNLVRQIFGLFSPVSMEISGENQKVSSPQDAIKHGISFVSGDREKEGTFRERSIAENLVSVSDLIFKQEADTDGLLSTYKVVYNKKKDLITQLSGGNQQKVVVARWTSVKPKLFLADDPTKGIDVQAREDVHQILRELAKEGAGVVMVSSDEEELINLTSLAPFSKIIVMYEGEIVKTLIGEDITLENIIANSMPVSKGETE